MYFSDAVVVQVPAVSHEIVMIKAEKLLSRSVTFISNELLSFFFHHLHCNVFFCHPDESIWRYFQQIQVVTDIPATARQFIAMRCNVTYFLFVMNL